MLVWGFDLGTTSVGFAAIEYDQDRRMVGNIKALGSRIFPEGITEKEREPRNKERRSKRMMRRQLRRKRWRRRAMHEALAEAGLLPSPNPKEWPAELTAALPYELRDRGLTEKLEPWEVGRALFHALKRRGFKSARLVDDKKPSKDEEKEEEGIKQQIADLDAKRGDKTVGAYIGQPIRAWRANPKGPAPKIRGQYTARAMAEEEFDRLWDAQAKHHPALMTPERKQMLRDTAFRQRPIFWRLKTLGTCSLEPGEPLAAKGSWLGQQFEMLQTLNNLKIATGNGRALDDNERDVLRQALAEQRRLTFGDARKLLKALWQENGTPFKGTKFNFEVEGGRKELHGNAMEAALRKAFGAAWGDHPQKQQIRDEAFQRLWGVNYRRLGNKRVEIRTEQDVAAERQKLIAHAMQHWSMARKAAEDFADTDMPAAWLHVSEKAIRTLLPALESGETYGAARPRLYPNVAPTEAEKRKRKRKPKSSRILGLPTDPLDLPIQRNPTVQRALTELRKVFNNLLESNGYRLPDLIRIELAREVALSGKDKKKLLQSIRDNTNERKAAEKALRERGVEPTGSAILKWRLWQECDKICPYTQETIGWEDLFGPKPKFDIEHITPRSRSQDDSFANKTLGHVAFNRNFKRNSTLVEAFKRNHGKPLQPDWPDLEQISSRLNRLAAENKFPRGKVKRLLNAESPEERLNRLDKFDPTERDLEDDTGNSRLIRDTAYIARTASLWLATMMPQGGDGGRSKVQTRNGRAVAHLRQLWRLNHLLGPDEKPRGPSPSCAGCGASGLFRCACDAADRRLVQATGTGAGQAFPRYPDALAEIRGRPAAGTG
ncbi:MAG: type II CRISPR RNA-guided endonuclease Cas9 [Ferrovibrio sp.]|nr:type II CRISPR RNA-guided endonuclease Cas9 [Ferrovibrio sp.]